MELGITSRSLDSIMDVRFSSFTAPVLAQFNYTIDICIANGNDIVLRILIN